MSKIVLLTGATGFVGRQVLRELVKHHGVVIRVVVLDSDKHTFDTGNGFESCISTKDMFSESVDWWAGVCKGVDTIVHVAWYAEPGKYLQSPKNLDCLAGTLHMAQGAMKAGVRRFVGIGTCFEYDLKGGVLSVETSLNPITPYAASKAAAYQMLSQYLAAEEIEFAWCRLFYLYGEGEDPRRLVPFIRSKLSVGEPAELTSGNQIRDFLDVRDAGKMIANISLGERQGPVNICSGIPITVRQLAEKIADEYGRRDLLKFGARHDNFIDPPCVIGIPGLYNQCVGDTTKNAVSDGNPRHLRYN